MITISPHFRAAYPQACAGFLAMSAVANPEHCPGLDRLKADLEAELRARFAGADRRAIAALPVLQAYQAYYRAFNKSYHVQLQLESLVWKAKDIPRASALVEAMFMAELQDLLLTAGHDLDRLELPVEVAVARGEETYTLLRGQEQALKRGDLYMADRQGVISSVLYGPDMRTRITPGTRRVLFAVYAVPGIPAETVAGHLAHIEQYVRVISPQSRVELCQVYPQGGE